MKWILLQGNRVTAAVMHRFETVLPSLGRLMKRLCFWIVLFAGCGHLTASAQGVAQLRKESLEVGGRTRTYWVHLPTGSVGQRGLPVLLGFHGGRGQGESFERLTSFGRLSNSKRFIVVYPDGIDKAWNDGRPGKNDNVDDVGFVRALIEKLANDYSIDRRRVYATGISNGGLFSFRLACELSKQIAGIAPVAANLGEALSHTCQPERPIPILYIAGDKDPLVPFSGGNITGPFGFAKLGKVLSSDATIRFWTSKNHCQPNPIETRTVNDAASQTSVVEDFYGRCTGAVRIARYVVRGGGHTWPGGWQYLSEALIGKTHRGLDASEEIWNFFNQ